MEVMVASPTLDYELSSNRSSPQHFAGYYSSAPSSPSRISGLYREFDYFSTLHAPDSASPSSSIQKSAQENKDGDDDGDGFAFLVSQESDAASLTAEELFDGGKIKPLKVDHLTPLKISPLVSQREKGNGDGLSQKKNKEKEERRGRDRTPAVLCPSNSGRRGARSHSPYRVSQYTWDEEHHRPQPQNTKEESSLSSKSSRKWRLRDFFLFRSASEGRGSSKDPLRKYSALYNKKPEDVKMRMRSTDSPTGSTRRGPISPHEFHYATKKAESLDLKKKTFLPYKQGILGRLAGLGSLTR